VSKLIKLASDEKNPDIEDPFYNKTYKLDINELLEPKLYRFN